MINQKGKHTVDLEDLLRLKRAERPSPEFWAEFDRELRAKQLAALVEKRPWWSALPLKLRGLARYHLPLGATAVLAITLVTLRDNQPVMAPGGAATPAFEASVGTSAPLAAAPAVDGSHNTDNAVPSDVAETDNIVPVRAEFSSSSEVARMVPTLPTTFANEDQRPSARSIAENRAVAEAMLGTSTGGFETRALPVRLTPREPLAQISNPSETHRSRFATAFAAAAVGTSTVPTARVARRLSDDQLYDTIHRFGASGNSVSFKF